MAENDDSEETEAVREMKRTTGGSPLPTGIDRRSTRRSHRAHSVYRAIKAEHSGEQTSLRLPPGCCGTRLSSVFRDSIRSRSAFSR
jgi:hypothetical protein